MSDELFRHHPAHAHDDVPDDPAGPDEDAEVPDEPVPPDVPAPPDVPEEPDEPVPPDVPMPPDVPHEPDDPVPLEEPDELLQPDVPEEPEDPVPPEEPDAPDPPEEPDDPSSEVPVDEEPVEVEPVDEEPVEDGPVEDGPVEDDPAEPGDDPPNWYDAVEQGLADAEPTGAGDMVEPPVEVVDDEGPSVDEPSDVPATATPDEDEAATPPDEAEVLLDLDDDAADDAAPVVVPTATRPPAGPVVVVTGGSGHIGSLVVDALVRDARVGQVVAVDRRAPSVPRPRVVEVTEDLAAVDLADLFATYDVTAVVHLAAILDPPSDMDDDVLHDLEVGGTQRVVEAAVATGVTHLTVTSSGAAYGYHQSNRGRRLTEDDPLRGHPDHAYARHKAEVEQLLAAARRLHPELGQLVLRLSTVLGPATANPVTRLFLAPVVLTLRDSPVPFSFVWDADVATVVTTGVVERRTGIYNVAGDGVVTMREVAELAGKRVVAVPSGWVERGLGLLARRDLAPFGPEQVDFLRHRPVLANDRLHRDFPGALTRSSREAFLAWVARDH